MDKYREITEARRTLGLPETATMEKIKSNYRKLLLQWHPDRSGKNKEQCKEMTQKIISAYKTISAYCDHYKYSFSKDEVNRHLAPDEWWLHHYGNDPLWGNGTKPK